LILYHGTGQPDYVRVWRGQRSLTYRCFDCGLDFYREEPEKEATDRLVREAEGRKIDDEDALHAAEDEIQRQTEEDDDRRCP
jgi:predicted  nucleic acid-binding Zn-ribbon protein